MCFAWISEQTAITSPYSIKWLFFTADEEEEDDVYFVVQNESSHLIEIDSDL